MILFSLEISILFIIRIPLFHDALCIALLEPQARTRRVAAVLGLASPSAASPAETAHGAGEQPGLAVERNTTRRARKAHFRLFGGVLSLAVGRLRHRCSVGIGGAEGQLDIAAVVGASWRRGLRDVCAIGRGARGLEARDLRWRQLREDLLATSGRGVVCRRRRRDALERLGCLGYFRLQVGAGEILPLRLGCARVTIDPVAALVWVYSLGHVSMDLCCVA